MTTRLISSMHMMTNLGSCMQHVFLNLSFNIGIRAQSTLEEGVIFAQKYTYEKLTKCANFT